MRTNDFTDGNLHRNRHGNIGRLVVEPGKQMSKSADATLLLILEELKLIRQALVKPALPTNEELKRNLSIVLGTGPDEVFNK